MRFLARHFFFAAIRCIFGLLPLAGAAETREPTLRESEETYELRLVRVMRAKGMRALIEHLAEEYAKNPKPYVKAWYANYLLYGANFGLKDLADPPRGFALAEESRKEGSLFGLELVGRAWGDGKGTTHRDVTKAMHYLREAAERGRDSAMCELGKFYFFGAGVPKDRQLAEDWMRKAACRGATAGMVNLAEWWENPEYAGVTDTAKTLALYYEAGWLGDRVARDRLRERAKQGNKDAERYVHLDLVVASVAGYDPLPTKLRAAVKWLEANASPDDLVAQLALAEVMMEREYVVFNPDAAKAKVERARAAGSDDARALEAMMAWRGIGRKKDEAAAVAIWQELAARGDARGLNQLGWLHWWGNGKKYGLPKDEVKAFTLCQRAADLGYWAGQLNVAGCYSHGIGVAMNYHLAAKYYGTLENRRYKYAARMKERMLAHVKD